MDRYTRKDAESAYFRLIAVIPGARLAADHRDVGGFVLDCNPVYGGYVINQYVTDGGGVRCPFGEMRRPAREFCGWVNAVILGLSIAANPHLA